MTMITAKVPEQLFKQWVVEAIGDSKNINVKFDDGSYYMTNFDDKLFQSIQDRLDFYFKKGSINVEIVHDNEMTERQFKEFIDSCLVKIFKKVREYAADAKDTYDNMQNDNILNDI